jgi:hypothetical protein
MRMNSYRNVGNGAANGTDRNGGNGHASEGTANRAADDWYDEVVDIIEVMRPLHLSGGAVSPALRGARKEGGNEMPPAKAR